MTRPRLHTRPLQERLGDRRAAQVAVLSCTAATVLIIAGGLPGRLSDVPEPAAFQHAIFKEPLLSFAALMVGWFVTCLRETPERREESRLLVSLPLSAREIADRLLWGEVARHAWVIVMTPAVYLALFPVSPLAYLARLLCMTIALWCIAVFANFALQVGRAARSSGAVGFPIRNEPARVGFTLIVFAAAQVAMMAWPELISGLAFWLLLGLAVAIAWLGVVLARSCVVDWLASGLHYRGGEAQGLRRLGDALRAPRRLAEASPLLFKNTTQAWRRASLPGVVATVGLAWLAYLLTANNEDMHDRAWVLLAIFASYCAVYAYRSIGRLGPEEEPVMILHALPLTRRGLHASLLLPALAWLFAGAWGYALLLLAAGSGHELALTFAATASIAALSLMAVATNFALYAYPDTRRSQRAFLLWCGVLILATALATRHFPVAALALIASSFFALRRVKLYQTTASLPSSPADEGSH